MEGNGLKEEIDTSDEIIDAKIEDLGCNVVYIEDWNVTDFVREQVIVTENFETSAETFFIQVAEDTISDLSVLETKETDIKTKTLKKKNHEIVDDKTDDIDLSWLIGFKLDGLMNNRPLDDEPTDARKREPSFSETKTRTSERGEAFCETRKKPPFTYTELIECALEEKGPLTVSEIYQWISETFPYYRAWDDRWKNSVRHNLSINPYFRKGSKAKQGSGHLWTVSKSANSSRSWEAKRQRFQEFEAYTKKIKIETKAKKEMEDAREAEIAASIIEDKENRDVFLPVEEKVTVEFIEIPKTEENNDFLNPPVSKEVLMGECGFFSQIQFNLATETENLDETEHSLGHLEEELGFQLCPQLCL